MIPSPAEPDSHEPEQRVNELKPYIASLFSRAWTQVGDGGSTTVRKTSGFLVVGRGRAKPARERQKTRCDNLNQHVPRRTSFLAGEPASMLIGYVRVSKSEGSQTLEPQRDALLAAGVEPDRIYQDLASGRHDARPGLTECLKALQPGNTLVIWKLDRLGRDLRHLVTTAEQLRSRGVGLKVLTGAGAQIDTTTANGRLAFGIFAAFAEFERELITERTQAGLAAARARGRLGGRPRKMDRATLTMRWPPCPTATRSLPRSPSGSGSQPPRSISM